MKDSKVSLSELLDDLANDKEKYNVPLSVSAKYAVRVIVEAEEPTYLGELPEDVKEEIEGLVDIYTRTGAVTFVSNVGVEDFSDTIKKFIALTGPKRGSS